MTLSAYHQKFADQPQEAVDSKIAVKEEELTNIVQETGFKPIAEVIKVGVLGCADVRYIPAHKILFTKIFKKDVQLVTFDITITHLRGEENVIRHDCTAPFPIKDFDIILSHVLLPFINTSKQADVVINAHNALARGGMAIHVVNEKDIEGADPAVGWQSVIKKLEDKGINHPFLHTTHRIGESVTLITKND